MLAFIVIGEFWQIACEFLVEMRRIHLQKPLSDCLIFYNQRNKAVSIPQAFALSRLGNAEMKILAHPGTNGN